MRWTPFALVAIHLVLVAGAVRADEPSAERGRVIATQGRAAPGGAVPPCRNCHGEKGIGDGSGAFPRLTGQLAFYLYKQLGDFASGGRHSPVMSPIAQALDDRERQDVAAYYAGAAGPFFPAPMLDPVLLQRGGVISASGLAEKGVPACIACHGLAGAGMAPSFPYLAGQYAPYLQYQLDLFRMNLRTNSPLGVMNRIASQMSEDDVKAVSQYLATVRPPCACGDAASGAGAASAYTGAPLFENRAGR
jgi:cytochrome c553